MKKIYIISIAIFLVLILDSIITYQNIFIVTPIETIYEKSNEELPHVGLIFNENKYYEIDDFAYFSNTNFTNSETNLYKEALSNYRIPNHKLYNYSLYLNRLNESLDYSNLQKLPRYKKYGKMPSNYLILKKDLPSNPSIILCYYEDLSDEIDSWQIFLRDDFNIDMLPTIENATVREIRIIYDINNVYVLNNKEKTSIISAIRQHSEEKIIDLFLKNFINNNIKNIIELEIEYENSPFIQYVGYYDVNNNYFAWKDTVTVSTQSGGGSVS